MKKKILLILALSLTLSACSKEEYVSQRHSEENKVSNTVSSDVKNKSKNESNENLSSENEKNQQNTEENKENKEKKDKKDKKKENKSETKQAYGMFTVGDISNIRREMSTDSEIVATIQPGTQVERTETIGEWSKVSYGEYEGYILTELLEDVENPEQ